MASKREERWVNGPKLLRTIRSAQRDARKQGLDDTATDGLVVARVRKYLDRLPDQPSLVGVTEAARILKVPKPRIMRFRNQGRLPEEVEVAGPSAPVYVREEVEEFAREIQKGRDLRRVTSTANNIGGVAA